MNIKRIGLIGGSYFPNSGNNTTGDSLWEISSTDRLQHKRNNNAEISIGTEINVTQTCNGHTDRIAIDVEHGIQIERDNKPITIISPHVSIGTGSPLNKNVFIGSAVYIETGFDSRNISSGGGGDVLWKIEEGLLTAKSTNYNIQLGTKIYIGTNAPTEISENGMIVNHKGSNIIYIGSHVHICEETQCYLTIDSSGIQLYDSVEHTNIITIPEKVHIGDHVIIGSRVTIQDDFDTNRYIDSHNNLKPKCIPIDSSLKNLSQLAVNIEPQSNGNIKIGNTLFMPATPSGDPMHYAYETTGAEYNDTTDLIIKDAPWKDMVDTIEDKAKWGFDVVDASQVKQMTISGTTYNYVQTTRQSPEGTTEPRYFLVGQASDGTWVEDETKVLHLPGHWYLNGLGDITNKEMRRIDYEKEVKYRWDKPRAAQGIKARTTIVVDTVSNIDMISTLTTPYWIFAETIGITNLSPYSVRERSCAINVHPTGQSNKTKYVQTCKSNTGTPFAEARVISFIELKVNCSLTNVITISKPSLLYTINNAIPTTPITITLHADRYAQLSDDADIVAALEAKNTALEGTGGSISLVSA